MVPSAIRSAHAVPGVGVRISGDRLTRLLLLVTVLLTAATALVIAVPTLRLALADRSVDAVLLALGAASSLAVGGGAWIRHRESMESQGAWQAGAFILLAGTNAIFLAIGLAGPTATSGWHVTSPGQVPLYLAASTAAAAVAMVLLADAVRNRRTGRRASISRLIAFGPLAVLLVLAMVLSTVAPSLPELLPATVLSRLGDQPPLMAIAQDGLYPWTGILLVVAAFAAIAALRYMRAFRQQGRVLDVYFAVALLVGTFGVVHFALFPSAHFGLITNGDLLRIAFQLVALVGLSEQARLDARRLRAARTQIELQKTELVARTALAERARLAREVHDGLAQELWLAKLAVTRLTSMPGVSPAVLEVGEEASRTVDRALAAARDAIAALRPDPPHRSLEELFHRAVNDFARRFSIPVELDVEEPAAPLGPLAEMELLGIVREGLTNAGKHARATAVRVRGWCDRDRYVVEIEDDGMGFDVGRRLPDHFGLDGIRERALTIDAECSIEAEPDAGTRIRIAIPVRAGATA